MTQEQWSIKVNCREVVSIVVSLVLFWRRGRGLSIEANDAAGGNFVAANRGKSDGAANNAVLITEKVLEIKLLSPLGFSFSVRGDVVEITPGIIPEVLRNM